MLLVNKPYGAKRFCIDFRALNMCISYMNWPLPVINQMLHRLGTHKPKYCAKFDMTKWYWQIALGVEVIEKVGHTIDGEGMHFSREKLSEVAQYPTLSTQNSCGVFSA